MRSFQAIQDDINKITFKLVPTDSLDVKNWPMADKIVELVNSAMGAKCHITFEVVKEIAPTQTGKHLYTVCNVSKFSY